MSESIIRAICHDPLKTRAVMGGTLEQVTEKGCLLICNEMKKLPDFAPNSRVVMNILDETSGRSVNVAVKLTNVNFVDRLWVYEVRWSKLPELWQAA